MITHTLYPNPSYTCYGVGVSLRETTAYSGMSSYAPSDYSPCGSPFELTVLGERFKLLVSL